MVIGIGEILWDLLPSGKMLGGAPANFAYHANQLGAEGIPVSAVGDDELGSELTSDLKQLGVDTSYIQVNSDKPTGTVNVTFSNNEPQYEIVENVAWDNLKLSDELLNLFTKADAVCFGTLAQRTKENRGVINALISELDSSCIKYFDLNLRQSFYSKELIDHLIRLSDILKLNNDELEVISKIYKLNGNRIVRCRELIRKFELNMIVLTIGSEGSLIITAEDYSQSVPVVTKIEDTIGAGDSFSAAIVIGLLHNVEIHELNAFANEVSSHVCSQKGGTPILPENLKKWIYNKYKRLEI